MQEAFQVSQRRACRATGVHRSLVAYRTRKPPQDALRAQLRELTQARVSCGYLRLHTLLRREGWRVNRKRVHRLYRGEGLQLRVKRPRRRRSAVARGPRVVPTAANQVWAMDFMQDTLADGRALRVLTLIDSHTREGKLPRQVDSGKLDSSRLVGLGRKVRGGTRPRLSWGRLVL